MTIFLLVPNFGVHEENVGRLIISEEVHVKMTLEFSQSTSRIAYTVIVLIWRYRTDTESDNLTFKASFRYDSHIVK